ncbi:M20/M25/M40 family metallo-hydrolase [Streptomyces sp. NRRL S-920]|uniref:M20/M25/M40 family metallo-hydrolase n=1 Tax=Streptomyces sp. NRRL S-920 TaxID=1463921 RepID=UPI000B2A5BEB|nr:M20/M25/M40 family metallo-hydrolase [Streptomyces sp. NRRL S-920]
MSGGIGSGRLCGIGDEAAIDLAGQIRIHSELGFTGLELRTVDAVGVHDLPEDAVRAIADRLGEAGLEVPVLDTPLGSWAVDISVDFAKELDLLERALRRAELLGCSRLRVMSYPNTDLDEPRWRAEALRRMRELTRRAADFGAVLLHENCHGWASRSAPHTVELITEVDSPALRLLFDTGNGLAYGYETLPFLREVLPWIDHVHIKDGVRDEGGNAVFGMPGEGTASVLDCVHALEEAGYQGWYSIEPHVALIPHLGVAGEPDKLASAYSAYGRRFRELVTRSRGGNTPLHHGGPAEQGLDPVSFTGRDLDWLMELMRQDTVSPFEGGDPMGIVRAQSVFVAGAARRGLALRQLSSPPPDFLHQPGVPAQVHAALAEAPERFLDAQPSVVVGMGDPQPPERRLVFNFHMDTVGPHVPPRLDARTLHGRGAVDDKGPGVAALLGVAAAFAHDPSLAGDIEVQIASVPGEEGGAMGVYGTRWLVESGVVGRLMVFAEPTGGRSLDACSAAMTPRWTVTGADSTDDHPYDGHNATVALSLLACFLTERLAPVAEKLGAKLCVAGLRTGTSHNRVYGSGQLLLNIAYYDNAAAQELGLAVEETALAAGEELRRRFPDNPVVRRLAADWNSVVRLDWLKRGLPPLSNRDPVMEGVLAAAGLPRHDGVADGTAFTCDAIWAAGPGRYVVASGPGTLDGNGAHTPDEHVDLKDLERYATRCRDLVLRFGAEVGRGRRQVPHLRKEPSR